VRTPTRRIGTLVALSAVTALALSACGGGDDAPATSESGVALVESGKLIACTHLPYEPFEFNDGGTISGFDVDIVAEVAKDLGVELEVVDTPFEGIQTGEDLSTDKCDVAAAGMTITDVREEALDFSDAYFEATQALMVKADSDIATLADLEGKKLGVQAATTGEIYAEDEAPGAELVQFEDLALLQTAVQTGQVDAAINDNGVLLDFVSKNDDVQVVTEFDTGEQYGIGVKTGNADLLEAVNATLERLTTDGTYDTIYEDWFGAAPATS